MTWELAFVVLSLFFLFTLGVVTMTISRSVSGFASGNSQTTITDNVGVTASPTTIPPAQPSVLTTRTNNTSGSLTMTNSSHGVITGQRVDLYWADGSCYHAVVGTVSGTTVPIASVGGGDNLPIATTAISVGIATLAPFIVTGDDVRALVMTTPQRGYFVFSTGSDTYAAEVAAAGCSIWAEGDTAANPLAGDSVTGVYMSHAYEAAAVTSMTASAVA